MDTKIVLHCWEVLGFVRLIPPKYEYLLTLSYIRSSIKKEPYIGFRILIRIWETELEHSGAVRSCLCHHTLDSDDFVVVNALDAMFDESSFLIRVCVSVSDGSVRFWEYDGEIILRRTIDYEETWSLICPGYPTALETMIVEMDQYFLVVGTCDGYLLIYDIMFGYLVSNTRLDAFSSIMHMSVCCFDSEDFGNYRSVVPNSKLFEEYFSGKRIAGRDDSNKTAMLISGICGGAPVHSVWSVDDVFVPRCRFRFKMLQSADYSTCHMISTSLLLTVSGGRFTCVVVVKWNLGCLEKSVMLFPTEKTFSMDVRNSDGCREVFYEMETGFEIDKTNYGLDRDLISVSEDCMTNVGFCSFIAIGIKTNEIGIVENGFGKRDLIAGSREFFDE